MNFARTSALESLLGLTEIRSSLQDEPFLLADIGARGGLDPRWARFGPLLNTVGFEPDAE